MVERVAAQREVIALDLPGFGDSPPDGTAPTVEALAGRVERFFGEVGVERPHVAGNSLGGAIALELGRRGAVPSVTAFSPIGFWSSFERGWARMLLAMGGAIGRTTPDATPVRIRVAVARPLLFLYAFGNPWRVPAEEIAATAEAGIGAPGFVPMLQTVMKEYAFADGDALRGLPLIVAWGSRDVLIPYLICSRRARRALPRAHHVTLRGCGHVPFFDNPEACAKVLLRGG